MQRQSRRSHRSVATRLNDEAEMIMREEPQTTEADINRLNQFSTLLARKQSYLVNGNEQVQQN